MKVASGTYHETVCLHMIALYFGLFWGESVSQLWSDSYPTWQETIQVFPAGHRGFKLRCADSHLSLFRLPVHTGQTEPNEAKKKIWYTHGFFCNAPLNEVIKHLSQDQKTGWQECCSVSENCVPPVIISWRVIFFLNRRKKVWWRDVLHNNTIEKWEPTTASARP